MEGVIRVVPKSLRNPYFAAAHEGVMEAARERGLAVHWDGPQLADARAQAALVERWAAEQPAALAVSVEDPAVVSGALRGARARGIKVLTWDADADADARDVAVLPATAEGIAQALAFEAGRMTGDGGEVAFITSTESAPNQRRWLELVRRRLERDSPAVRLVSVRECHDDERRAADETRELMAAHPALKAVVGLCAPAVPGAARALGELRRPDVRVTGLSMVDACRKDIEEGRVESIVTWSPRDLGYLTVVAAQALVTGELAPGSLVLHAGRLGHVVVQGDEVRLGRPRIVSKGNLGSFAG